MRNATYATTEGKALDTRILESGDLLIEGWAADFSGIDRQNENFVDGAFTRGIKAFLSGQSALCYHHKTDHGIGKVLDLREVAGKGLWMKARVDFQEPGSPLRWVYNGVKKGSYKGLSVGGFFKRKLMEGGYRIADVDLTEVSVTPVAVHPRTAVLSVSTKAMGGNRRAILEAAERDLALLSMRATVMDAHLEHAVAQRAVERLAL